MKVQVLTSAILAGLSMLAIVPEPVIASPQCDDGYYWHDALQECKPVNQRFRKSSERACQMPGTPPQPGLGKCTLGGGSGGIKAEGDPDMDDREGVPPSAGAGSRVKLRGSGRELSKEPIEAGQIKAQGGWEICLIDAFGEDCFGDMPRADAEAIVRERLSDPDLTPGVKIWAQEIRG